MTNIEQFRSVFLASLVGGVMLVMTGILIRASAGEQVTVHEGTNFAVAASPNGEQLAIDIQGTLWILDAAGGKAKALTDRLADARLPQWSPDGEKIAFQSYRDGNWHIWIVDREGKTLYQVTDGPADNRSPAWAEDGKGLYFASDRSGSYEIWWLSLEAGELTQITNDAGIENVSPSVNSEGSLAYISRTPGWGGTTNIKVFQPGENDRVVYKANDEFLAGLSWMPGSKLGVVAYDNIWTSSRTALLGLDLESGKAGPLTDAEEDVFPFRSSYDRDGNVYYAADGAIKRITADNQFRKIPFSVDLTFDVPRYRKRNYDFSNYDEKPVKGLINPALSPSGERVAVAALGDIWLLHKSGEKASLTSGPEVELDPAFSPDGRFLVYTSDKGGNFDIWLYDLEVGNARQLTSTKGGVQAPVWSPDGSKIAFLARTHRGSELMTIDVKGQNLTTLKRFQAPIGRPSWSADSESLAYLTFIPYSDSFREGRNVIEVLNIESGDSRILETGVDKLASTRGYTGPQWSPDGKYMAVVLEFDLWLLRISGQGTVEDAQELVHGASKVLGWDGASENVLFQSGDKLRSVNIKTGRVPAFPVSLTWSQAQPDERLIIKAGRIFDGLHETYRHDLDIAVEGNRITEIAPRGELASYEGRIIDASDKTLIPGLIESHAHDGANEGEKTGRVWLGFGVTTVRVPGSDAYSSLAMKESVLSGRRVGPRRFFAGGMIDGSRVYYASHRPTVSREDVDLQLKWARELDYDLIKTYVRLPNALQKHVVTFAAKHGIQVASHELYPAAAYGVSSKEHIKGTPRDGFGSGLSLRSKAYEDVIGIFDASKMSVTPTISLLAGIALIDRQRPEYLNSRQYKAFFDEAQRQTFKERIIDAYYGDKSTEELEVIMRNVRESIAKIAATGARVAAGSDCPLIPCGLTLQTEIALQTGEGGLSHAETLFSATRWAAEAMGVGDQLGQIREGFLADLVILDGDPLKNISDTLNVSSVIANGHFYTLDALLQGPLDRNFAVR